MTTLDMIDRRYALVRQAADGRTLVHEAKRWLDWLTSDPMTSFYARELEREDRAAEEQEQDSALVLMKQAEEPARALADVVASQDAGLARCRDIIAGALAGGSDNETLVHSVGTVDKLLRGCAGRLRGVEKGSSVDAVCDAVEVFHEHAEQLLQSRAHRTEVSPGAALRSIIDTCRGVCLEPVRTPRAMTDRHERETARDLVRLTAESAQRIQAFRAALDRVHTEIACRVGTSLSHRSLVARFKMRCSWYDGPRLRASLLTRGDKRTGKPKLIREKEGALVEKLARYLFDNGVWAFLKARIPPHEFDLLAPGAHPLLVEGKAYTGYARKELVDGIAQLHAYMTRIEGTPLSVREAYYVLFRLDGPIYELPEAITINRYRIHTHTVDLGEARSSGRRQPKPIVIPPDQLLGAIERRRPRNDRQAGRRVRDRQ